MAAAGGFQTGGKVVVIIEPAPLVYAKVFHTGSGPDRHIKKKAQEVAILASQLAPLGNTGKLKSSIKVDQNRNETGNRFAFGYRVYTKVPYAGYVHEGTDGSPRRPNGHKAMKWRGNEAKNVYRDFVWHPGIRSQPFLQNALIAMVG